MFRISTVRRAISLAIVLALFAVPAIARPAHDGPDLGLGAIELVVLEAVQGLVAWVSDLGTVPDPIGFAQAGDTEDPPSDGSRDAAAAEGDGGDTESGLSSVPDPIG